MVSSTVAEKGEARKYTRYFIKSLTDLHEFADYVRKHWSTENQLHWCLYVIFREDSARARKDLFTAQYECPAKDSAQSRFSGTVRTY